MQKSCNSTWSNKWKTNSQMSRHKVAVAGGTDHWDELLQFNDQSKSSSWHNRKTVHKKESSSLQQLSVRSELRHFLQRACTSSPRHWAHSGTVSPSQCDADINQARLTCCLTYCSRWHAYLRGGAVFFFVFFLLLLFIFLSASLISKTATSLSCSFHLPGWQLTVLWLSRSPLLWLITSQTSHCTGISAGPHTVPSEKFNRNLPE